MNLLDIVHRTPVPAPWAAYGTGYDLAMLIYGEFNVFRRRDARRILHKAHDALIDGGTLLIEPSIFESVRREAEQGPSWCAAREGLFSELPHLCLEERFWDDERCTLTTRYWIVDAATGHVEGHAASSQAYTDEQYRDLLHECGFTGVTLFPSLGGTADETQQDYFALVARKGECAGGGR